MVEIQPDARYLPVMMNSIMILKARLNFHQNPRLTILYQSVNQKDVPVYHKIVLENYAVNKTDPQKRKLGYLRLNQEIYAGILKSTVFTASYPADP